MATSYSTNLALALPVTGELSGTWGTVVNSNITNMLDEALGYQAFTATGGSDTLTIPDGTTGVARSIYIQLNGTGGGTVNVPTAKTKMYFVFNNTASAITFKVTGQTGVSIPAAAKIALVSNGTDIITAENYFSALTLGAALPVASGGTSLTTLTANNVILGNGTSAPTFVAPSTSGNVLTSNGTTWQSTAPASGFSVAANNTFTGTQSFAGTSSNLAEVLTNAAEVATVSATAATGTINYDVTTQSVQYYTSNASANWTVNFRASSGTSLNTAMTTGQSVTVAFLVTQGSTAYYNNVVQVDGTTSGVTTRWLGGAPTAGNASGIDSYRYLIIKTGSATFTVLASNTQFKA